MTGPSGGGAEIRLDDLSCAYGRDDAVVRSVSLVARRGELLTILGPSGSGKTTTLMMVAGFVTPTSGDVFIGGRAVGHLPPEKRNLGVVFQSYALFPHMSVHDNVAFPLRMRRVDEETLQTATADALSLVRLSELGGRAIHELSGGQQQRVALARALVFRPPALLMDEPLGALDRKLREQMQLELKRIQRELGVTVLYVTHDQEEALALSDRIAILHGGVLQQVDSPKNLYERPASALVAEFFGESNFLEGVVESTTSEETRVRLSSGPLVAARPGKTDKAQPVQVMIRPEDVRLARLDRGSSNNLRGTISGIDYLGSSIRYTVDVGHDLVTARAFGRSELPWARGAAVSLTWEAAAASVFPAGAPRRDPVPP